MQHGMSSSYGGNMTHDPHSTGFQGRDTLQEHAVSRQSIISVYKRNKAVETAKNENNLLV